jgi:PAS domain S-box-containing protein
MAEIFMSEGMLIISETDKHGIITFANEDFMTMSGYDKNELIGKPHNIIRHPDMPPVAFKNMWDTIKEDKTWNGFLCNKSKSGDHYWVYATVSAVKAINGDRHYISIRRKPTRSEIEYSIALYKSMKQEA